MKTLTSLFALFLLIPVAASRAADVSQAAQVFDRYLKTPCPPEPTKTDLYGSKIVTDDDDARLARMAVLEELKTLPKEDVVAAAEKILFDTQVRPRLRQEIVGTLADYVHTPPCAELLHRVIQDVGEPKDSPALVWEELIRSSAVHGLRMMARRTDRRYSKRTQMGPDFEAEVKGLVPYLVSAANDPAERVRVSALFGLADTRDPAAVIELKNRLNDKSEKVRFLAAYFLTEYDDASGFHEIRKALTRFQQTEPPRDDSFEYYIQLEKLFLALERITGASFGEIPMNPHLCSNLGEQERIEKRYKELLYSWTEWWKQHPNAEPVKRP